MKVQNNHQRSREIMQRSRKIFPGGVNSPVRAFGAVGGDPVVFARGSGKHLFDVDGNCYIDFCSSWGPLILGYSHPTVVKAVQDQAALALTFGAPSEHELRLAETLQEWMPGLEMLRFVNSGTEATMSALRVARAATGRSKIVKFQGCYHGHSDGLLVAAGSGLATFGTPHSAGVTAGAAQDTLTARYNSVHDVTALFDACGADIAAVIVEPVACNMGLVPPAPGFLEHLRTVTKAFGAVLIFDEVMTGLRLHPGGAAAVTGVQPDLWALGKIVGGGLPAAAYGGSAAIMAHVAPLGKAYQAGTLSGNPLAMVAGYTTLCVLRETGVYAFLEDLGRALDGLVAVHLKPWLGKKVSYVRVGSFFCFFFGSARPPQNFDEVSACDMQVFARVFRSWIDAGIYMGPSGYEVGFLSACHSSADLELLVKTCAAVLTEVY